MSNDLNIFRKYDPKNNSERQHLESGEFESGKETREHTLRSPGRMTLDSELPPNSSCNNSRAELTAHLPLNRMESNEEINDGLMTEKRLYYLPPPSGRREKSTIYPPRHPIFMRPLKRGKVEQKCRKEEEKLERKSPMTERNRKEMPWRHRFQCPNTPQLSKRVGLLGNREDNRFLIADSKLAHKTISIFPIRSLVERQPSMESNKSVGNEKHSSLLRGKIELNSSYQGKYEEKINTRTEGTANIANQRVSDRNLGKIIHSEQNTKSSKNCFPRCCCCPQSSNKLINDQSWFFNKKEIKELSKMGIENPTFIAKPIVRMDYSDVKGEERKKEIHRMWKDAFKKVLIMNRFEKNLNSTSTKISTKCLIMPGSRACAFWTIVVILLLIYTAIVTPFVVAFLEEPSYSFTIFELCIDGLFAIDIIVNFFSPYYDNNLLVTQKWKIAKHYMKGWFFIDLIACIPFHLLGQDNEAGRYNRLLRLLRIARLYRLLRLFRLVKITKMLKLREQLKKFALAFKLNPGWLRLLKMFIGMLFFVHIFSCGWFMTAKLNDFAPDTWVVRYGYRDSNIWRQYLAAIYCIFQTITTVGYGDLVAITTTEHAFCVVLMAFGVAFYSFSIGNISSIVSKLDHHNRKLQMQLTSLRDFAKKAKLPIGLLIKMRNHIEHKYQDLMGSMNQETLLKELPATLRAEVLTYTHRKLLQKVKFFAGKDPEFLWQIIPKLKPLALREGEILFREGDYAEEVYFILEGTIKMIAEGGYLYKTYNGSDYFGEIELLQNTPRESSARAETDSEILFIEKETFLDILEDFSDIRDDILQMASLRDAQRIKLIAAAKKSGHKLEADQYQLLEEEMQGNLFNDTYIVNKQESKAGSSQKIEENHSESDDLRRKSTLCGGNENTPSNIQNARKRRSTRSKSISIQAVDIQAMRRKTLTDRRKSRFSLTHLKSADVVDSPKICAPVKKESNTACYKIPEISAEESESESSSFNSSYVYPLSSEKKETSSPKETSGKSTRVVRKINDMGKTDKVISEAKRELTPQNIFEAFLKLPQDITEKNPTPSPKSGDIVSENSFDSPDSPVQDDAFISPNINNIYNINPHDVSSMPPKVTLLSSMPIGDHFRNLKEFNTLQNIFSNQDTPNTRRSFRTPQIYSHKRHINRIANPNLIPLPKPPYFIPKQKSIVISDSIPKRAFSSNYVEDLKQLGNTTNKGKELNFMYMRDSRQPSEPSNIVRNRQTGKNPTEISLASKDKLKLKLARNRLLGEI